ncbi:hypothetical protein [Flavobacterium sp. FlaQc-48]|uniref:hypothetical protein n=1 Tax=Flavobacterium sp. FlaQc-48 TaxID=3374181 RepID=UPI003757D880
MKDLIERTNKFYIDMSRSILSEKEYEVLHKLLIEKISLEQAGAIYRINEQSIHQIYERVYNKVKDATELLGEIDQYKEKLKELKSDYKYAVDQVKKREAKKIVQPELSRTLEASQFPFSKRMHSFFEVMDIRTIGQLAEIPLEDFHRFRGFKEQCKKELISFIEFENIERYFKGFSLWKTRPIE